MPGCLAHHYQYCSPAIPASRGLWRARSQVQINPQVCLWPRANQNFPAPQLFSVNQRSLGRSKGYSVSVYFINASSLPLPRSRGDPVYLSVLTPSLKPLPSPLVSPARGIYPLSPSLALSSRKPLEKPMQLSTRPKVSPTPHFPNTLASLPKGHSPGWGHLGWPPEKNPEQYPGDAGTDEPNPVCGGLMLTRLGSPLPPGPRPLRPTRRPPGSPSTSTTGSAACQEATGSRKNRAALQPRDLTRNM